MFYMGIEKEEYKLVQWTNFPTRLADSRYPLHNKAKRPAVTAGLLATR